MTKLLCDGRFLQRIKILATLSQQFLCGIERYPGARLNRLAVFIRRIDLIILLRPTGLHDGVRVARWFRLMNNDGGYGAFFCSDFVFVSPASVVGHRVSLKYFRVEF